MTNVQTQNEVQPDTCKGKMEIYSRVVGFYRPVGQWNVGKQEEFEDRIEYKEN